MQFLEGDVLTPSGWVRGAISFSNLIETIEGELVSEAKAPYIIPGFVDLHVHGGNGHDMMDGEEAIFGAAKFHAQHGTTSLLATSVTAPIDDIEKFLHSVNKLLIERAIGRARVLGAHLEGPFINPKKLGAQPPFATEIDVETVRSFLKIAPLRVITYAPEMDKSNQLTEFLKNQKTKLQIGHSICDYACAKSAIESGSGVTHLYNAMSGIAHRDNGVAGAALAHADFAEIIPDLIHVEEGALLAARRAIPNLYGVTDAMSGAGMPDGEFQLGNHKAIKQGLEVRLKSGELAGSVLTMDKAFRNLVEIGLTVEEASRRLSSIPAKWIGEEKIGQLETGSQADVLVLNSELHLQQVYVDGEAVHLS